MNHRDNEFIGIPRLTPPRSASESTCGEHKLTAYSEFEIPLKINKLKFTSTSLPFPRADEKLLNEREAKTPPTNRNGKKVEEDTF